MGFMGFFTAFARVAEGWPGRGGLLNPCQTPKFPKALKR